ncbi:SPOR domain-containing protein [Sagittula salina]|uniref:SPOR domain-containing protein n=1 Tax=Sagittula salina TaxID=2820268 RepID=A0A940MSE7_9RHOB|nr:SPOR domain-containing protein [Sagittula salina]MBP0484177.1 SPOR domain-containing protein [Sagittula salina]
MSGSPIGSILRAPLFLGALVALSACADGQMPGILQPKGGDAVTRNATGSAPARTTERDVEAPEIFAAKEAGLWDGRPSLGGVWVAHPDVKEPERAIIRNTSNGQYVIGALFRKERATPGPRLQVSSDAAAALGMLAGAPTNLDVVALRREEAKTESTPADAAQPVAATGAMPAAPDVTEGTLDPVAGSAAAALAAPPKTAGTAIESSSLPAPSAPKPTQAAAASAAPEPAVRSGLQKPYLQIGIFSVEENARNTAVAMRQAGLVPTVIPGNSSGKPFWRVVVGPAQTTEERATLLKTIKKNGFEDAYAVTD